MRTVRPCPRLPREAVAAPSLAVLKARLDRALGILGWWKGSLPTAGVPARRRGDGTGRSVTSLPTQTIL